MIAGRWRREAAFGCGYAALYFAVRAVTLTGLAVWFCCAIAAALLACAVRLTKV